MNSYFVCADCIAESQVHAANFEEVVEWDLDSSELEEYVEVECAKCGLQTEDFRSAEVNLIWEVESEISSQILACEAHGCGIHRDKEDDTPIENLNSTLRDLIQENISAECENSSILLKVGGFDEIFDDHAFRCLNCGCEIDSLDWEIKTPHTRIINKRPPIIPESVRTISGKEWTKIEYFRSDLSTLLGYDGCKIALRCANSLLFN